MSIIKNGTCIRFRPAKPTDKDYIYIMWQASGCSSFIGRQGGAQVVHLSRDGCMQYGVVAHVLLHVIGLGHQHNAFNRDEYVYINESNIAEGKLS